MNRPDDSHARAVAAARVAVLTVSDTRSSSDDVSGNLIVRMATEAGHVLTERLILRDEPEVVRQQVLSWCGRGDCDAVLITGGTGLARRDTTIEAVDALMDRRIDGFGELFRMLSFAEIGAAAMLSRAAAGARGRTAIFCMPGSPAAVRLAMDKLILPALPHLTALLR